MTRKQIMQAIESGKVVVLKGDPLSRLCYDLFGQLVVISLRADTDPIRLATRQDKRNATIQQF